jgi:hypothetical protein
VEAISEVTVGQPLPVPRSLGVKIRDSRILPQRLGGFLLVSARSGLVGKGEQGSSEPLPASIGMAAICAHRTAGVDVKRSVAHRDIFPGK